MRDARTDDGLDEPKRRAPVYALAIVRTTSVLVLIRGWAPFVALLVAYEAMRDLASVIGLAPHNLAPLDRTIFAGYEPTLVLQGIVDRLSDSDVVEDAASLVYAAHWILPAAVGAWFWIKDRNAFNRFGLRLVLLCALAFATYVMAPTSPPWLAQPDAVRHVIEDAIVRSHLPASLLWLYMNHDYNLYAAFPSLHSGFPVVVAVSGWQRNRVAGLFLFAWAAVVWIAVVYLGEHYVTDVVGGILYAVAAIAIAAAISARWPKLGGPAGAPRIAPSPVRAGETTRSRSWR